MWIEKLLGYQKFINHPLDFVKETKFEFTAQMKLSLVLCFIVWQ